MTRFGKRISLMMATALLVSCNVLPAPPRSANQSGEGAETAEVSLATTQASRQETPQPSATATVSPTAVLTSTPTRVAPTPRPTFTPSRTPVPRTPTPEIAWELVWSDEFDGEGKPDPNIWVNVTGDPGESGKTILTGDKGDNVRVEGGNLIIEGRHETGPNDSYTSGSLVTFGRKEILYGRVEVRARLPVGPIGVSNVWLLGSNVRAVKYPACGQIGLMAYFGLVPEGAIATINNTAFHAEKGNEKKYFGSLKKTEDDFHLFIVDWFPDKIDFIMDGSPVGTYRNPKTGEATWPFDQPFFLGISLNLVPELLSDEEEMEEELFPLQLLIDYVRVYQEPQ